MPSSAVVRDKECWFESLAMGGSFPEFDSSLLCVYLWGEGVGLRVRFFFRDDDDDDGIRNDGSCVNLLPSELGQLKF